MVGDTVVLVVGALDVGVTGGDGITGTGTGTIGTGTGTTSSL